MQLVSRMTSLATNTDAVDSVVDTSVLRQLQTSDLNSVGRIVESMLTEAQFQSLNGTAWILADGRSVTGSKYATVTGFTTVPNLRGVHLRGKNNGRADGNQDSAGERALGAFQSNALPNFTGWAYTRYAIFRDSDTGCMIGQSTFSGSGPLATQQDFANSGGLGSLVFNAANSNAIYQSVTDVRVRNVAVNVFIKIND